MNCQCCREWVRLLPLMSFLISSNDTSPPTYCMCMCCRLWYNFILQAKACFALNLIKHQLKLICELRCKSIQ
ncbi:hypothetical protein XELAEV_18028786mg [Xenopus laevis]|uniref:Secreted protein n=1 Tax=Xenopus laevis TaxID=8355 RepID=A0A974CQV5_XENLA|nr:hypothetical protein XELAEV_18028786mg [Xenopus laevis]